MNELLLRRRNTLVSGDNRPNYLKMVALEDNTDISIVATGTPYPVMIQYSRNGGTFIDYTIGNTITINTGETIEWRRSPDDTDNKFSKDLNNYYNFNISKTCDTTGYVTTLLTSDGLVTSIPNYAFVYCQGLVMELELPPTLISTGTASFRGCKNLYGNLVFPEGFTTNGQDGFQGCMGINGTVTLPSTLTSLGQRGFGDMSYLRGPLVIPEGVTTIPQQCFAGCRDCKDITIPSTVTSLGLYAFSGTNDAIVKCLPTSVPSTNNSFWSMARLKIYVPYSSDHSILTAYQTAWSNINIYELDEDDNIPID